MIETRVIPCLLLKGLGLVKTVKFKDPKYVGDPINAVRIFNDKEVDELVLLDIEATVGGRGPNFELVSRIAGECFMPMSYGGGLTSVADMRRILSLGVEKVVVNSAAISRPQLIREAAETFGSQSVIVSIDAKRDGRGRYSVYGNGGRKGAGIDPVEHAVAMQQLGAGELFLNAIDRDGTMEGYDIDLIRSVTGALTIPVVACGGAGSLADFADAVKKGGASAVSAGSLFVFRGKNRAVLITFPTQADLRRYLQ